MMNNVQRAWRLVQDQLKGHAGQCVYTHFGTISFMSHIVFCAAKFKWRIEEEWLQSPLNLDTTLDFFIPTTTGYGACTFALVHYLTYVHNNFIDSCRAESKTRYIGHNMCDCSGTPCCGNIFFVTLAHGMNTRYSCHMYSIATSSTTRVSCSPSYSPTAATH